MKVLVIAAHPDDEVYGMGGTIAKLSAEGHDVSVLIMTDGCTAQYRDHPNLESIIVRKQREASAANTILGVREVFFGKLPDMRLDMVPHIEINQVIEQIVEQIQPNTVFTHFYGDVNLDHQIVYQSTLVALRPMPNQVVKTLYCYEVPSSTEWSPESTCSSFLPNTMVDISNYVVKKEQALLSYGTELREYPHPRSARYIAEMDHARGLRWGLGSSEAFCLMRKRI